ncbi:hypothetical protein M153_18897000120 [Pseudoloma neurophilia]|uniref:Uncharacterized protein n=1 Tax=Pseudoloma neurophilia TaxID=146866 RepID=A0A0R0M0N3_9MICR|nr:hypothetical protein M153_18897000120 [Pseudoloma neurophilia]
MKKIADPFMTFKKLFTIHKRKNELRHFGTKIGNCWFYNEYEMVYLLEKEIIFKHPIQEQSYFKKLQKDIQFSHKYSVYKYLKDKQLNILDGKIYEHTKEFNRKLTESTIQPVLVSLDDSILIKNHMAVISSFDDKHHALKIYERELSLEISDKLIKRTGSSFCSLS